MTDKVLQIEVILNFLNTLFGKAISLHNTKITNELSLIRKNIYYGDDFEYDVILKKLQALEMDLNQL